ncbi:MAG TPA: hypothetical protein DFS52_23900 [Myxococcales bacterium]|jgi:uncharacterized membrane protein|nr:hypothetical protein [Myxococcales bacterium]
MKFKQAIELSILFVEALGVATLVVGAAVALLIVWKKHRFRFGEDWYHDYRRYLGRAILLGLEFLVAADIIRSVAQTPTMSAVAVLGVIVLIRTFLSFTLQVEIEGSWPWAKRPSATEGSGK